MLKKNRIVLVLLVAFFLLSLFLRLYHLSDFPIGFHVDEASLGYNAFSLLSTGKDDNGNFLPLYIDMFGDNRPSGYHFLTILPVMIFGLTEFATRFSAALFGALTVFAMFFVAYGLTKKRGVSLLASFLMIFSPWNMVLSRASGEAVVALFCIMLGLGLQIWGFRQNKIKLILLSFIPYTASFFFYHTPRVFVPLLLFSLFLWVFYNYKLFKKKIVLASFSIFILAGVIAGSLVLLVPGGTGRFSQVNIFTFPETKLVMEEQIREDGGHVKSVNETRLYHNKILNYTLTAGENYFQYFTGGFLFIRGGLPRWYIVPNMGLLYLIYVPFLIYGLYLLAKHNDPISKIIFIWILLSPITAAITVDDIPNVNRVIILFPALELATAYGFIGLYGKLKKRNIRRITVSVISILFVLNVLYFFHQYFVHSYTHRTWYRNNGFRELMTDINKNYDSYDKIIFTKSTGGIYPLVLFYSKFNPKEYQKEGSTKDEAYTGFGKFFFVPQACPFTDRDDRYPDGKRILYVEKGECEQEVKEPEGSTRDIFREDGTKAYRLVETGAAGLGFPSASLRVNEP